MDLVDLLIQVQIFKSISTLCQTAEGTLLLVGLEFIMFGFIYMMFRDSKS